MMAIESYRLCSIEATELVELGLHDVLEGAGEPRMKKYPGKAAPPQVRGELALMFCEASTLTMALPPMVPLPLG